jgi:Ser/Thr protein kinase RdoA (MazF antagonist)
VIESPSVATWSIPAELRSLVEQAYNCRLGHAKLLTGGYECVVILIDDRDNRRVLRVAPRWRSVERLEWSYELVALASLEMAQICAPIRARDSGFVITYADQPISLWPFVEGRPLDASNEEERDAAATALAQLQRQLVRSADRVLKPCFSCDELRVSCPKPIPAFLKDEELDQWLVEQDGRASPLDRLIHGDYWSNNLVCQKGKLIGIIDWDDTGPGRLDRELARALWEFCADSNEARINMTHALRFLDVYRNSGGLVPVDDLSFVVPFIREYLRNEVQRELKAAANAQPFDHPNLEISLRAFAKLRGEWT